MYVTNSSCRYFSAPQTFASAPLRPSQPVQGSATLNNLLRHSPGGATLADFGQGSGAASRLLGCGDFQSGEISPSICLNSCPKWRYPGGPRTGVGRRHPDSGVWVQEKVDFSGDIAGARGARGALGCCPLLPAKFPGLWVALGVHLVCLRCTRERAGPLRRVVGSGIKRGLYVS